MKYRRTLAARPRESPEPGDRVHEGREAARRGGGRLAGEIRLSGTRFNELEGPRRDLAGHLSIGHGVDTTPLADSVQVEPRPGGALAESSGAGLGPVGGEGSERDGRNGGGGEREERRGRTDCLCWENGES